MKNKKFIFLYPQKEIIDFEIYQGSVDFKTPLDKEKDDYYKPLIQSAETPRKKEKIRIISAKQARDDMAKSFKKVYSSKLNQCIGLRYRKNGFSIYYSILDDCKVSEIIKILPEDRIIKVGMTSKTHRTKRKDGSFPYPDPDYIINQILPVDNLVVAGFHMWDCVQKLAKRSYERGIDTLVDEDLTEFFSRRINDPDFDEKVYPTYNPRLKSVSHLEMFMEARKNKPWLWQEY